MLADNESASKLYERCGFKYEGEFHDHLNIGGKYMNWKWYGLLENEYNGKLLQGVMAGRLYDILNHLEGMVG